MDEHIALAHMLSNYEGAMTDPASMDLYHRMAAEITKAVNFYNYNNRQQALRRVYLCGGGAEVLPAADLMPDTGSDAPWLYTRALGCALQA